MAFLHRKMSAMEMKRERNPSLIPAELMHDNGEGGRERAALATVFGVPDYTEYNLLWQRQKERTRSITPVNGTRPDTNQQGSAFQLPNVPIVSHFSDIMNPASWTISPDSESEAEEDQAVVPPTQASPADTLRPAHDQERCDVIWEDIPSSNLTTPLATSTTTPTPHNGASTLGRASRLSATLPFVKKIQPATFGRRSWRFFSTPMPPNNDTDATAAPKTSIPHPQTAESDSPRIIRAATVEKLIEYMTLSLDYTFMTDFFLTFRGFIRPVDLCHLLSERFRWSLENDQDRDRCIARIRTFVALRHWLLNYFVHDFLSNHELRVALTSFLNALPFHPRVKASSQNQRIVRSLKRIVRRLKKVYYSQSADDSRVKIIAPPPPPEEHERVEEMVRARLSRSPVRRSMTFLRGIRVSNRHHGNVAAQDGYSPIVVIGRRANDHRLRDRFLSGFRAKPVRDEAPPSPTSDVSSAADSRPASLFSYDDGSLKSAITPGTNDDEREPHDDEDDENDDGQRPVGHGQDQPLSSDTLTGSAIAEQLAVRLEAERLRRDVEQRFRPPPPLMLSPAPFATDNQAVSPSSGVPRDPFGATEKTQVEDEYTTHQAVGNGQTWFDDLSAQAHPTVQSPSSISSPTHPASPPQELGPVLSPPPPLPSSAKQWWRRSVPDVANTLSSPPFSPSLPPTPSLNSYSFFLQYRSRDLAEQLCLIERDMLLTVDWEEMVHCGWTRMGHLDPEPEMLYHHQVQQDLDLQPPFPSRPGAYTRRLRQHQIHRAHHSQGGIEEVIKRFNTVCQWVSSEIVRTPSVDERAHVIGKFIRLADKSRRFSNYSTLVQILLGLQSPSVSRLTKTWARVDRRARAILADLSDFTSPTRNWKHIRDSMTEVADVHGMSPTEIQVEVSGALGRTHVRLPFGGCIPFLGIYLSDLVFNSEQPAYLDNPVDGGPLLVHYRKYRVIATVIKRVLTFQYLARRYAFEREDSLYTQLTQLDVLDADLLLRLSRELE